MRATCELSVLWRIVWNGRVSRTAHELDGYHSSFSGFNVSCPWQEVAVSTVSFSLLYPVLSFSVVRFEYSFVYVSLHSA
jgi:hypothetical protein